MSQRIETGGFSLIELCAVLAIIGLLVTVSVPAFFSYRRSAAVRVATAELRAIFHSARSMAVATGRNTAVVFRQGENEWHYSIYQDCDGDGVRTDDIRRGVDRLVVPERRVSTRNDGARIGMPRVSVPDPDTNEALSPAASPVRFNRAQLCSFAPTGSATAGSIFITDGDRLIAAVRVYGPTGRIRSVVFDRLTSSWKSRS